MNPVVACADIGSVKSDNFGWCDSTGASGNLPSTLARQVARLLKDGQPVALGFECPLFVPLPDAETSLGAARPGEGTRAWSAGAGAGVLATGLVQVVWVLREVRSVLPQPTIAYLDWGEFAAAESGLFLWEAFVSGGSKGDGHVDDARLAVAAFEGALPDPEAANAIRSTTPVHSLVGAALLRTGWSFDPALLSAACLVVKV